MFDEQLIGSIRIKAVAFAILSVGRFRIALNNCLVPCQVSPIIAINFTACGISKIIKEVSVRPAALVRC